MTVLDPRSGAAAPAAGSRREALAAELSRECPELAVTAELDRLRGEELSRLDGQDEVYLDYTGGGLYAASLVRRHAELLLGSVLGNPHSGSPAAARATALVERCRRRVLAFFRAAPDEYVAIFTANATQASKLVGEAYPFAGGGRLLLTFDNHNSVVGIRELARSRGGRVAYAPLSDEMRVEEESLRRRLRRRGRRPGLFAYPAQSNFSGVQHSLSWVAEAQAEGWDVLLDAAAYVPTHRLDLSRVHPDFVTVSFYKMFGHPTGVGALLARREALARLHRPWFAGGTIEVASVRADRHLLAPGEAAFEDGTLSYSAIPAVEMGLDFLDGVGMEAIETRVTGLVRVLLARLAALRHPGGRPLVRLYGPADTTARGGTVAFNFHDAAGRVIDHRQVEELAARRGISLRTGCFCNPGAGEAALHLGRRRLTSCFAAAGDGMTAEDFRHCVGGSEGSGAVRVSLGMWSTAGDLAAFLELAESLVGA